MGKDQDKKMQGMDQAHDRANRGAQEKNMNALSTMVTEFDMRAEKLEADGHLEATAETRDLAAKIEGVRDGYRAEYAKPDKVKA